MQIFVDGALERAELPNQLPIQPFRTARAECRGLEKTGFLSTYYKEELDITYAALPIPKLHTNSHELEMYCIFTKPQLKIQKFSNVFFFYSFINAKNAFNI